MYKYKCKYFQTHIELIDTTLYRKGNQSQDEESSRLAKSKWVQFVFGLNMLSELLTLLSTNGCIFYVHC